MNRSNIILIVLAGVMLCGFSKEQAIVPQQPSDERKAQDTLPKSRDPMWALLGKTKIHMDYKSGMFTAVFPEEVKALVGKDVTIGGFMLPLEATEKFHHFIISKRTPTCPFCPPGEPNEIVDVWMEKPIAWEDDMIKVKGKFELMNNPELGLFFKVTKAQKAP